MHLLSDKNVKNIYLYSIHSFTGKYYNKSIKKNVLSITGYFQDKSQSL